MRSFYSEGQRFKNGNLNIRFSADEIAEIKSGKYSDIEMIAYKLEAFDSRFIGESYCLSNYESGATIYSWHDDCVYILNFSDIEAKLMQGKTLKLYARKPDENDREMIAREYC